MEGGVSAEEGAGRIVEHREAEQPHEQRAGGGVGDHGQEVVDPVEGDDRREAAILGRHLGHHLPAGRLAEEGQAGGIDPESARVAEDEGHRVAQVVELLRVADVRGEAVVDREPGEAGARERLEDRRDVRDLVSRLPASAVDHDHSGEGAPAHAWRVASGGRS